MLKDTRPRMKVRDPLTVLTNSMMPLYELAKQSHFNVTGPTFYGDHKTYDEIADVAMRWFDILGERMRALQIIVSLDHKESLVTVPDSSSEADYLSEYMLGALENLSAYINANVENVDGTTGNMIQELDTELGKMAYFVRSSRG